MRQTNLLFALLLSTSACGGQAVLGDPWVDAGTGYDETGAAGHPPADAATVESSSGVGGTGGAPSADASPVIDAALDTGLPPPEQCVPSTGGSGGFQQPTCADLNGLGVEHPVVQDDGMDGVVSHGEGATIQVDLREVVGEDFMFYPGVTFEADHPAVKIGSENWLYGIFACSSTALSTYAYFGEEIPPGTVVTVTARVAMLSNPCPMAPSIEIPIVIH